MATWRYTQYHTTDVILFHVSIPFLKSGLWEVVRRQLLLWSGDNFPASIVNPATRHILGQLTPPETPARHDAFESYRFAENSQRPVHSYYADEHGTLVGGNLAGNYKVESIDDMQQRQTMVWIRIG